VRQLPLGGISDDPQRGEGNPAMGCRPGGDMRFHVHRMCAGPQMQRALAGAVRDRLIDPRKIDDGRAKRRRQRPGPGGIGGNRLAILDEDPARDEHRAGREARRKTAGDAEANDGPRVRGGGMQIVREAGAVAAAREGVNLRPGGELRLGLEAGDRDHPPMGGERAYIPNCVVGRLPLFRLR